MRVVIAGVLLLAGCDVVLGLSPRDPLPDGPPTEICLGGEHTNRGGLVGVCVDLAVQDQINLPAVIDTDNAENCTHVVEQTDVPPTEVCVIAAQRIDITKTIRAQGQRPLVLVAIGDLTITSVGAIDVKSRAGSRGAGASVASCEANNGRSGTAGSGAAGGGFGTRGGGGGATLTIAGGVSSSALGLAVVRGGCRGGTGGPSSTNDLGGLGGDSGGAVYLIAGGVLQIAGILEASGGPGAGGQLDAGVQGAGGGGGGGGSGGLIGLDAPVIEITMTAELNANGGGGGGGGGTTAGSPGADNNAFSGTHPWGSLGGAGGTGAGGGAIGGQGVSPNGATGVMAQGAGGGGGGGGGVGFIRIYGQRQGTGTAVSPAANM